MNENVDKKGIGIIFHSGSYDRIYHGLSISLSASALGWESKCFFSYWSLDYLRKEGENLRQLDSNAEAHKSILEKNIEEGHIQKISDLMVNAKAMGAKFYVCTNSMGLLNIARNELIGEVDKSTGLINFLKETADYNILFI